MQGPVELVLHGGGSVYVTQSQFGFHTPQIPSGGGLEGGVGPVDEHIASQCLLLQFELISSPMHE